MYSKKKRREGLFFLYIAESRGGSGNWFSCTGGGQYDTDEKSECVDKVFVEGTDDIEGDADAGRIDGVFA